MSALQSVLSPAGSHAREIAILSWWMFAGATLILLVVLGLAAWAVWGRARPTWLADTRLILFAGLVFPTVVLIALLIPTLSMGARQTGDVPADIRIRIVGEQWWWRVTYLNPDGTSVETANEIRIPLGADIALELETADVIHSFWVPALAGKMDMIPGQTNVLRARADVAGTYRGQCAEFCGGPHALMSLYVIAQEPEAFAAWLEEQHANAGSARGETAQRGYRAFFAAGCGACHSVRGTPATGRIGPDLTHVGGRGFIAGGTMPTNRENIRAWIAENQDIKPHNKMPEFGAFASEDLDAIAAWLETLK